MAKHQASLCRIAVCICGFVCGFSAAYGSDFDYNSYQTVPIAVVVSEHAGEGGFDATQKNSTMLTIEARINKLQDMVMYQGRKRVISDMHRKLLDGYLKATKNSTNFGAIHPILKNEIEVRDERGAAYWIPIQESLEKRVEGQKWVRLFLSYNGSVNDDPVLVIHNIKAEDMFSAAEKELTGRISRRDDAAYRERAMLYLSSNLYSLAIPDFRKAMEVSPNDIEAYFNCAIAYYENYLKYGTRADLTHALEVINYVAEAHFTDEGYGLRGSIYFELKDYANALKDFNVAVRMNPENKSRLDYFIDACREHGK